MLLYHATSTAFEFGTEVTARENVLWYPEVVEIIEKCRPIGKPSRSLCIFAVETVVAACAFYSAQPGYDPSAMRIFRVEMPTYHKAPFRLVHEISKRLASHHPTDALAAEYWAPTYEWFAWEFFGPTFNIIEEVAPATAKDIMLFKLSYDRDYRLAATL